MVEALKRVVKTVVLRLSNATAALLYGYNLALPGGWATQMRGINPGESQ